MPPLGGHRACSPVPYTVKTMTFMDCFFLKKSMVISSRNREILEKRIRQGYRFIAYSVDIRMLDVAARIGITTAKEERNS